MEVFPESCSQGVQVVVRDFGPGVPAEARATAAVWRVEYDESRPHNALGYPAPGEFARFKAGVKAPRPSRKLA